MAHLPQGRNFAEPDQGAGGEASDAGSIHHVPPRTPYEEAIAAIWRDVIGSSGTGVFDDFFEVGGHSLLALKVVARIHKTLGVNISVIDFFASPTVAALARMVAAGPSSEPRVVGRRPSDADPMLSFDQQRLWLESQLLPAAAYNVHGRRRLVGRIDVAALGASIRAILARHEALRTRFPTVDGRPTQVVDDPDEGWRIGVRDMTDVDDDRAGAARRLLDEEAATPFDLARGPLFRCLLIKLSDTEHLLSVTMHHIVSDAWSIGLFVRELSALYEAGGDVNRAGLPALPIQYRDYAVWQRGLLIGEVLDRQVSYWRRHLDGAPPALALPTVRPSSKSPGARAERVLSALSREETAALHDLCRKHGVSPFMALLAALAAVLGRWSGQSDVVIGVPVAGRNDAGTDKLIGFFVNTLPLRVDLSGSPTFADLLGRARQVALGGYARADAPLDVLVKELNVTRDPRRAPLFQVILNVIDHPEVEQISGAEVEPMEAPPLPSKFELALTAQESDGALQFQLDSDPGLYHPAMQRILLGHLRGLLLAAMDDPTRGILDYAFPDAEEGFGGESSPADRPVPGPHLAIERHVQFPDRVAVIDGSGQWSYRWLSQAADRVAQALAQRSSPRADHIGVVRRPAASFVAAVLGCMKASATFSVIEAAGSAPAQYLGISTVLDVSPTGEAAAGTIDLSALLPDRPDPPDPPQTGHPSPREPSARQSSSPDCDWAVERFGLSSDDRFAVLSNLSGHLLSALSSTFHAGGTLVIPEPSLAGDIGALTTWLRANSISVVYVNPPVLRALAAQRPQPDLPTLSYVFVENSGDLMHHDIDALRRLSATCRCVGLFRVGRDGRPLAMYAVPNDWPVPTARLRIPLGTELPHVPAQLLHPAGQPATTGEVAEICVGSYRTGDLARRWHDGSLEFVGRVGDSPAFDAVETVAALRDAPEVRDAVVTEQVGMDGRATLLGYLAGPDPKLGTVGLHNHLVSRLPEYLIPEHLIVLDRLPLTAKGDYDLSALPAPQAPSTVDSYVAPRTPMEHLLTEILQELLAVDRVGIHDSFFELGGFSLLATQLTSRIRATFNVELSLRAIFESPTVDGLSHLIVQTQGELVGAGDFEALLDGLEHPGPRTLP